MRTLLLLSGASYYHGGRTVVLLFFIGTERVVNTKEIQMDAFRLCHQWRKSVVFLFAQNFGRMSHRVGHHRRFFVGSKLYLCSANNRSSFRGFGEHPTVWSGFA